MKTNVASWETIATYVATYDSDGGTGACDVEVQIGQSGASWYVRTTDDAGGSDEADDTAYATRDAAVAAAEALASDMDEGDGASAEEWERRELADAAGESCADGEWACYWDSACVEDCGVRGRYETQEQAQAAVDLANAELHERNTGDLLCAYEVRQLVDGEWIAVYD